MTEYNLKKYFEGSITVEQLALDLKGSQTKTSYDVTGVYIDQLHEGNFEITISHLLKLCNDAINGFLPSIDINTVAFALITSEYFVWDEETEEGKIISETLFDWDNPEINFPLTKDNFAKWRKYLQTGSYELNL